MGRSAAIAPQLDGEGEFGEGRRQPIFRVGIRAEFVVAAAHVLNKSVSGVNGSRKLTPWRHLKIDPLPVVWSLLVGGGCGRDAAEVSVFESVAVALKGEDFGVVDESVDHRGGYLTALTGASTTSRTDRRASPSDRRGRFMLLRL
jgi:hypothetical protein